MSDDTISRQEAIKALNTEIIKRRLLDDVNDGMLDEFDTESILRALPPTQPEEIALHESCTDCPLYDKDRHSCPRFNKVIPEVLREVQSEQRWIPCSERLPEALQEVIVTSSHGYVYTSRIVHGKFEYGGNVLAWMPLPEPYAERRQDDY